MIRFGLFRVQIYLNLKVLKQYKERTRKEI